MNTKKYLGLGIASFLGGTVMLYKVTTMQPYAIVPPSVETTVNILTIGSAVMFVSGGLLFWLFFKKNASQQSPVVSKVSEDKRKC